MKTNNQADNGARHPRFTVVVSGRQLSSDMREKIAVKLEQVGSVNRLALAMARQTTAGHALCYKLTSLFGIAHGHAAILCDRVLFPWMLDKLDRCADPRGPGHLAAAFQLIADAMDCPAPAAAAAKLAALFASLSLSVPAATPAQFDELCANVNPVRLKNHPIVLTDSDIADLYRLILVSNPA